VDSFRAVSRGRAERFVPVPDLVATIPNAEGARGDSRDGARDGDRDRVPAIRARLRSPGETGARRGRGPGAGDGPSGSGGGILSPDRRGRPTLRDAPRDPGREAIAGDGPLVLDFGARWNGYCSDETVTILPRRPRSPLGKAFDAVRRAQAAGISSVRPGEPCRGVDARVRDSLDRSGYLKYFVHSTGHGVGLDVHERPSISPRSRERLEEGMVVTVEPGVYLPGIGGSGWRTR